MPLRIAFFGLPLAALLLERDGHSIEFVAVPYRAALGLRRALQRFGTECVWVKPNSSDPTLIRRLGALAPELIVSWFWTTRLPPAVLRTARLGAIGAHPSLLPRHRGPDPTYWTIALGDAEAGVTVHRLEEEYDTGAILAQERMPVDPTWNAWELARALDRPSLRLLRTTVAMLARGEALPEATQDPVAATAAPFPDDAMCAIRWRSDTCCILRQIRALSPAPGAWTEVDGAVLTILRAAQAIEYPQVLSPGDGAVVGERVIVRTGDGAVELIEGEIDGVPATKRELTALFLSRMPSMLG